MSLVANLVDGVLERSVVGSFTRVGSAIRRRLDRWAPLDDVRLEGRVVVMTGATSGLGLEAARAFARMGATVEVIARDATKAEATCGRLRQETGSAKVDFVIADTGDLTALRRAAATLLRRHAAIHVLIHNAGALDDVRQTSPEGIEQTVASQVVGPFLLTSLLLPALRAGAPAPRALGIVGGNVQRAVVGRATGDAAQRLQRNHRLRAGQAGPGDARGAVGQPTGNRSNRGARHAPRLGRHAGRRAVAADVPARRWSAPANTGGRGGHARLARRRRGGSAGGQWPLLARPPAATAAPPRVHAAIRHPAERERLWDWAVMKSGLSI